MSKQSKVLDDMQRRNHPVTHVLRSEGHESHVTKTRAQLVKGEDVFSIVQQLLPHSLWQIAQQQVTLPRMLQISGEIFDFVADGDDLAEDGQRNGEKRVGEQNPASRISAVLRQRRDKHSPIHVVFSV